MLDKILNLEGVIVLDKKQQYAISGGDQCNLTVIRPNGNRETGWYVPGLSSNGEEQIAAAESVCGNFLSSGYASRCFYDCQHDGFGQ